MEQGNKRVIIMGGGIAGLTAAYYLQKMVRERNLPLEVLLIEASHRLGGKMQTVVRDGFVIERGPDSFLARKKSMSRLAAEVGMDDKLVSNSTGQSYVLVNEKLHPMPGGSIMGIPTQIAPFLTTGLFSVPGKMRAAADFILPKSPEGQDQSLGKFFKRRLGPEVVENLIEPLLSGIYAGDIYQLSLMSTFPQFYEVEQKHRSLIVGMKKTTPAPKPLSSQPGTPSKGGAFLAFRTGFQSFADAIESKLDPKTVLKGHKIKSVVKEDGYYEVNLFNGEPLIADCIISAVPHHVAQSVFSAFSFFEPLKSMPATSVATVALVFPESAIKESLNGTGFLVSRNADYTITACTWTHKKWAHSAPPGKALLRCYVGRAGDDTVVDLSDDKITEIVLEDLKKSMNITEKPEFVIISRWKDSMPQYTVGHKQRLEMLKQSMAAELPGVYLAGASYEGVGLPDCIDQGEAAVKSVLNFLGFEN
ncbi:protoporphyrinogen oxidase [Bacillus sp. FJAT-27225]|uniref:protoporphyrinogen oxidase n=1 Tax=Bacillus sp. FJAT-27225 TaxID=1743144 RepID=UPI00080C35AC|nr:protoporphyrinogen oxidase [Bacillus sp. FJAT-27225]OCA84335.1 protoporphyrinogen oxidase [Bacillus sp. FJAT-27225]